MHLGVYDSYNDSPNRIKTEGMTISLMFQEGLPGVGQGTVTWNIPDPGTDNSPAGTGGQGAYAGFLVLLSEWPLTTQNLPFDSRIYTADPTANRQIHSGDKIGNALVVGAFYEQSKLSNSLPLTTTFVINDLNPNTSYYVGGFAADPQFRYHTEGVRAYSDKLRGPWGESVPARQFIKLGSCSNGGNYCPILPSAGTGLVPSVLYQFDISVDYSFPYKTNQRTFRISINGSNALTYTDLINELNKQFSLMYSPPIAPVSPGTNQLYWNSATDTLFQLTYDPTTNILTLTPITNVIVDGTDPALISTGTYWYDTATGVLSEWNGTTWVVVPIINFGNVDPIGLNCNDYWYDTGNTKAYVWNGVTWCTINTINSLTDPSCPPPDLCGAYWYDTVNQTMNVWNVNTSTWDLTSVIIWPTDPTILPAGTYWFDLTTTDTTPLYIRSGSNTWISLPNCIISTTQPNAAPLSYWYNPTTEVLQQFTNIPTPTWTILPVLVWTGDPTIVGSCDLWWNNPSGNVLAVWSVINSAWIQAIQFYNQPIDPSLNPIIPTGTLWYNETTGISQLWDGASWIAISVVVNPSNPLTPAAGDAWLNPVNNIWYIYNGSTWTPITPIDSIDDETFPLGTYWYNTTTNTLSIWNGTNWVVVSFTTTPPFPQNNQTWFNSSTNTLYSWDNLNSVWKAIKPPIYATFDCRNYIILTSSALGSRVHIKVLIPGTTTTPCFLG